MSLCGQTTDEHYLVKWKRPSLCEHKGCFVLYLELELPSASIHLVALETEKVN